MQGKKQDVLVTGFPCVPSARKLGALESQWARTKRFGHLITRLWRCSFPSWGNRSHPWTSYLAWPNARSARRTSEATTRLQEPGTVSREFETWSSTDIALGHVTPS